MLYGPSIYPHPSLRYHSPYIRQSPEMASAVSSPLYPLSFLRSAISTSVSPSSSCPSSCFSLKWAIPHCLSTPAPLHSGSHRPLVPCAINIPAKNSSDSSNGLVRIIETAQKLLDDLPQPIKIFPWARALESFIRLLFNLFCAVAKYLSVPVLAISSLSEISYCGHERKLVAVPVPFLLGFTIAGVLSDTATELSFGLKEGEFPWHLLLVAIFFLVLKLPGPYYPYWGRLLIPHFANGGLWKTIWLAFVWYRRVTRTRMQPVADNCDGSS